MDERHERLAEIHNNTRRARRALAAHILSGQPLALQDAHDILAAGLVEPHNMASVLAPEGAKAEYLGDAWTAELDDDGEPVLISRGST